MIGKNNPFNIRYCKGNHWIMSDGHTKGFVNFKSLDYGIRAACILVMRSYRMRGCLTISEIINRFAPPFENKTDKYIEFVCSALGCFPFDIPNSSQFPYLLSAMARFEGNPLLISEIKNVIDKFDIKPYKPYKCK